LRLQSLKRQRIKDFGAASQHDVVKTEECSKTSFALQGEKLRLITFLKRDKKPGVNQLEGKGGGG